ncbi:hypothetical protein D3C81_1638030 [compost metagenome]
MNVPGHFRIGTGQGAIQITAATDNAIEQAVELYRGTKHTLMPAIFPWRAVAKTHGGWVPVVTQQGLEHPVSHRYRQLYGLAYEQVAHGHQFKPQHRHAGVFFNLQDQPLIVQIKKFLKRFQGRAQGWLAPQQC